MTIPRIVVSMVLAAVAFPCALVLMAQTPNSRPAVPAPMAASAPTAVPALVPYSGLAVAEDGKPVGPEAEINFLIFRDEQGGDALWMETQSVVVDPDGHYKVQLGASSSDGLPMALFSTGEARWLEVQVGGEKPQPRVLLASVPYALKAGDATTLGGLPVSAFALVGEKSAPAPNAAASPDLTLPTTVTTTGGTAGYVSEFSGASTIVDSPLFVSSSGEVGINQTAPTATLDVNGTENVRGILDLPPVATATATAGQRSQLVQFTASAWDSATSAVVSPIFKLLANFDGNNTASPSGDLELHYQQGPNSTNILSIANTGVITFAPTQTFPGTLKSVTATSPLTALTLNGATNLALNTTALETTLDATYPTLTGGNVFTGTNTFNVGGIIVNGNAATLTASAFSANGTQGEGGVSATSDTGNAVFGQTETGIGVYGDATIDGTGGYFSNSSNLVPALYATNGESYGGIAIEASSAGYGSTGVSGSTPADDGIGVGGEATGNGGTGISGTATGGYDAFDGNSYGVYGNATSGTGVFGTNGASYSNSFEGLAPYKYSAGTWGDTNVAGGGAIVAAVAGTADNNSAGYFYNKSADYASIVAYNEYPGPTGLFKVFKASSPDGTCGVGGTGDLSCTGQLKSLVSASGGARKVETYAMQSPENWMEDFGSGVLERGVAVVTIDPAFADTVTADASYHVFITPEGDSKGLYVIRKTATSFEVRESGGGVSSLSFDYRIVAKRRGYEAQRLTDVTASFNAANKPAMQHPLSTSNPVSPKRPVVIPSVPPAPRVRETSAHATSKLVAR